MQADLGLHCLHMPEDMFSYGVAPCIFLAIYHFSGDFRECFLFKKETYYSLIFNALHAG